MLEVADREATLRAVEALYDRGQYVDALDASKSLGPLDTWRGEDRVLASRLAGNLGGGRQARVYQWLAHREAARSPLVQYFHARWVLDRKGPLRALRFMQQHNVDGASDQLRGEWLSLLAFIHGMFRDFDRADALHEQAVQIAPGCAWIHVERAGVLINQDRYDEALALMDRTLEQRPWYRPAVLESATILMLLARDDDAIDLLGRAGTHLQSASVHGMRAMLLEKVERYDEARAELDRVLDRSPLMDKHLRQWNERKRADVAYACGDVAAAVELYRKDQDEVIRLLATHIEQAPPTAKKVELKVPFVRQHHQTCAPATLTMISRFWSMPADHLAVAEQICYDGTPAHSERKWATDGGWLAREFTVTADAAKKLIDRGIPFTLTTSETTSGHLQAVIGYDELKRTLLIRDPTVPLILEMLTERLLERYASTGPRGWHWCRWTDARCSTPSTCRTPSCGIGPTS